MAAGACARRDRFRCRRLIVGVKMHRIAVHVATYSLKFKQFDCFRLKPKVCKRFLRLFFLVLLVALCN